MVNRSPAGGRLMVLGAGLFQLAGISRAVELGCEVVTVDNDLTNPGHRISQSSVNVSTTDVEAIVNLAEELSVDGVVTFASDVATSSVAAVGAQLDLPVPSLGSVSATSDKARFRRLQATAGFSHPRYVCVSAEDPVPSSLSDWSWPIIVKPTDSSGSRGVGRVDDVGCFDGFIDAALAESRSGRAVVEEFVSGVEVGGDLFLVDGDVVSAAVTNKHLGGFLVLGHSLPSELAVRSQQAVVAAVAETCRQVGLHNGAVNFDVIVEPTQPEHPPVVLELSPRTGGNGIPELVRHATGFDAYRAMIQQAFGLPVATDQKASVRPCGSRVFGSTTRGVLLRVERPTMLDHPERIVNSLWLRRRPGDHVDAFDNVGAAIGYAVFGCRSTDDYGDAVVSLDRLLRLTVEPERSHRGER